MFTGKTFDFLIENRLMNSKEWFHEHKDIYEEHVLKPITELSVAMGDTISSMDGKIVTVPKINKTISRIYRDTRFSKDKSLFRESVWLSFKRDKKEFQHYPEFYVVLTPQMLIYGCGYYYMKPETMQAARELILADDKSYKKAFKAYKSQNIFTIDGDYYKRSKYPDEPVEKQDWLNRKSLNFARYTNDFSIVFSDDLAETLCNDIVKMKDVYDFLILAEQKAAGLIV